MVVKLIPQKKKAKRMDAEGIEIVPSYFSGPRPLRRLELWPERTHPCKRSDLPLI